MFFDAQLKDLVNYYSSEDDQIEKDLRCYGHNLMHCFKKNTNFVRCFKETYFLYFSQATID